jgi:hypothetical protein
MTCSPVVVRVAVRGQRKRRLVERGLIHAAQRLPPRGDDAAQVDEHLGWWAMAVRLDPELVDAPDVVAHVAQVGGQVDVGVWAAEQHRLGADHMADVVLDRPARARRRPLPVLGRQRLGQGDDAVEGVVEGDDDVVAVESVHGTSRIGRLIVVA